MKIFVVEGHTGEYEDYQSWIVASYFSEQLAKERVTLATEAYKNRESDDAKNPYDEEMKVDYTGTKYFYYSMEITDSASILMSAYRMGWHDCVAGEDVRHFDYQTDEDILKRIEIMSQG